MKVTRKDSQSWSYENLETGVRMKSKHKTKVVVDSSNPNSHPVSGARHWISKKLIPWLIDLMIGSVVSSLFAILLRYIFFLLKEGAHIGFFTMQVVWSSNKKATFEAS